jgi:hypothetical protein
MIYVDSGNKIILDFYFCIIALDIFMIRGYLVQIIICCSLQGV